MIGSNQKPFASFWLNVADEYPYCFHKRQLHVKFYYLFATTYMCETAFSALTNMKTNYRSEIPVKADLRVCLSQIAWKSNIL